MTDLAALPRAALVGAYAVIFISQRRAGEHDSYGATADRMLELAAQQPGYIGVRSVRDGSGLGITVSYWQGLEQIAAWRAHAEHTLAREQGRDRWYERYELQISRIERAHDWQHEA